jgi:hypothetical protein
MKRYSGLTALLLIVAAVAPAQEGSRVVVPARNTSRPRLVRTTTVSARITVHTHPGTDVIVETSGGRSRHLPDRTPDGLHRIDLPPNTTVSEDDNVINIRGPLNGAIDITVPENTSLQLKSVAGPIRVDGVKGEVDASCTNGSIELTNVSGTIVADTTNGPIRATMDRVDPSKPISFSSVNGLVDVTLPADVKANVKLRTTNGSIWTAFDVHMAGGLSTGKGGTMIGTINGGGVEASFSTVNGRIEIRKK